ncbi:thioredoxin family protein [Jannaschia aquimarina]|uniref:AhpC/TSA family protein n=1 Tax=Jannaschia aquimarina TaxID=935700 RepID=A0A0D1CHM0_9RHOB|nr:thioredoxin family protein [Jannaschia aquimarina]KIT14197.1 AhpC/TSA family protein [Jannaschia aquimarina]SNS47926.1 AhpC/TSA family protein [Jannaschia aquimarina]
MDVRKPMALTETDAAALGTPCPDFALPDPRGRVWTRDEVSGPNGLVVAFICNHCPYVIRMIDGFASDLDMLGAEGVGAVCVMSNDWHSYPADAPERMGPFAETHGLAVPYVIDADQAFAREMGAVCTPDLFGFGPDLRLAYRGRHEDLVAAMRAIAGADPVPEQTPGMGCSIKWRS